MALQTIINGDTGAQAAAKILANDQENAASVQTLKDTVFPPKTVTGTVTTGQYINNVGAIVAATGYKISAPIPVVLSKPYGYTGRTTATSGAATAAMAVVGYNADGTFNSIIKDTYDSGVTGEFLFTVTNASIKTMRVCSREAYPMGLILYDGLISSDAVAGLPALITKVNSLDSGINNLTGELESAYLNSTGGTVPIGTWSTTKYIPVDMTTTYSLDTKTNLSAGVVAALVGFDDNNVFVAEILHGYDSAVSGPYQFKNTNPLIKKIRACSVNTTPLRFYIAGVIPSAKVENLPQLINTVNLLVTSGGAGPIPAGFSWAAIGDSITAFDVTAVGYQSYVKERITFTAYSNQGYSGRSLTNAADRASILEGIAGIGAFGLYTLLVGTNDFKLNRPIGTTADYLNATGGTTFYGALRATVDLLYTKQPACKIIFMTPLRRNNDGYSTFTTNTAGHKLSDYRDAIEWVAKYEALTLIDTYNDSGITDRNLGVWTSDGLHPITSGHRILSRRLIDAIRIRI